MLCTWSQCIPWSLFWAVRGAAGLPWIWIVPGLCLYASDIGFGRIGAIGNYKVMDRLFQSRPCSDHGWWIILWLLFGLPSSLIEVSWMGNIVFLLNTAWILCIWKGNFTWGESGIISMGLMASLGYFVSFHRQSPFLLDDEHDDADKRFITRLVVWLVPSWIGFCLCVMGPFLQLWITRASGYRVWTAVTFTGCTLFYLIVSNAWIVFGFDSLLSWMNWLDLESYSIIRTVEWILDFVLIRDVGNRWICLWWITVLACMSVLLFLRQLYPKLKQWCRHDWARKQFHIIAVLLFLPALVYRPLLLSLGLAAALALVFALELLRVSRLFPEISQQLDSFLHEFVDQHIPPKVDSRKHGNSKRIKEGATGRTWDNGPLVLSHVYLILGCALPVWLTYVTVNPIDTQSIYAAASGIIFVGLGDTFASVIGHAYGRRRWSTVLQNRFLPQWIHRRLILDDTTLLNSKRTVEGSFGFFAGSLVGYLLLNVGMWLTGHVALTNILQHLVHLILGCSLGTFLEAFSVQNDNLVLPLWGFVFFTANQ